MNGYVWEWTKWTLACNFFEYLYSGWTICAGLPCKRLETTVYLTLTLESAGLCIFFLVASLDVMSRYTKEAFIVNVKLILVKWTYHHYHETWGLLENQQTKVAVWQWINIVNTRTYTDIWRISDIYFCNLGTTPCCATKRFRLFLGMIIWISFKLQN